ncbi:hypothetical protein GCM10010885_02510 [Alicyclobacillus cellulosilyticus]|uniref:Tetrapyrrole biosynthesis uroporphyrinogen III synthase domain-containing protein n=1 Tax=Alicyclobacillus cellulosilyticus TaxID=1003997 RepID=A0A917NF73_9BACL|nr:uroporphyrinogen-III synthase [Alicyclobacillus cellulosilyticus]GGI96361.1 hypothetical protein GCM10010885_02510 [Alicyclobacillus cellulosilyticus]
MAGERRTGAQADLAGVLVVITRPPAQAAPLAARVNAAGGEAWVSPLIEIAWLCEPAVKACLLQAWLPADAVAFTSANAVRAVTALAKAWGIWAKVRPALANQACFAVGKATAAAARAAGWPHVEVPPGKTAADLVAHLAGLPPRRWFVPLGDRADGTAFAPLTAAGHEVRTCVVYTTRPSSKPVPSWPERLRRHRVAVVVFASPSAVAAAAAEKAWLDATDVRIVAIGPTTARACRAAGLPVARVADEPSEEGLWRAVLAAVAGGARPGSGVDPGCDCASED